MVRSIWKRTLVTTFAWAGLAWAQQPIPSSGPATKPGESTVQTITVQEMGKAGQKCKVLKTWRTADGKTAYQVQASDTGEMMTIVESGAVKDLSAPGAGNGSHALAVATRIFHWGSDRQPPPGTPVPPIEYVQKTLPTMPHLEPKKMAIADQLEAAKPTVLPRPEVVKPPIVTRSEPAKRTGFFSWFSRSSEPQIPQTETTLPQMNPFSSAPMPPSTTTPQNSTTTAVPSSAAPRVTEPRTTVQNKPSSTTEKPSEASAPRSPAFNPYLPPPSAATSPAPVSQPTTILQNSTTTAVPNYAAPRVTEPRTTVQNQPSSTTEKPSETPVSRPPVFTPSWPSPSAATSPAKPQPTVAPQRLVQVLPPKNDAPPPATTTNSMTPAAPAPKSPLLNQQAIPVAPVSSATIPTTNEKKPANGTTNSNGQPTAPLPASSPTASSTLSVRTLPATPGITASAPAAQVSPPPVYKPSVSSPSTTPYASLAPANATATAPKGPTTSVPSTASWPQASNQVGAATMPMKRFDDTKPAATTMAPSTGTNVSTPAPVTPAPPSDWRKSWGKVDDGKAPTAEKPVQSSSDSKPAAAKPVLPQADSKRPDPLQMPAQYDRRPVDEKPSAQKSDTMLVPATAVASSTAVKPAVATVTQPAKVSPPVATMPVPLGAQSVLAAGDPPPGWVRTIPVPMVTIPDVRRAPVPPMTPPAQVYGASSGVPAVNDATQGNAFSPAPSRQVFAQASNAFGSGAPVVPAMPSGPTMPASASAGMMAQTTRPAGSSTSTNPSVTTAGFQGAALANQTVPAAYQTTMYQAPPPCPSLTAVKSTPDNIQQMVTTLRDSLYPSQREWAAESMATVDWRSHPEVVQALTTAAKEDPAATVRADCVRCLAKMNVNMVPVITVVRDLKNDSDPRVRQEAERALSTLATGAK